jgi:hypothetical protein
MLPHVIPVHQVHLPSIRTVLLPPPQLAPQIFSLTQVLPTPYRYRPLPNPPSPRTFPCIYIGRALSQSPSPSHARPLIFVPLVLEVLDVLAPMPKMAAVPRTPPRPHPGQRKHPGRHRPMPRNPGNHAMPRNGQNPPVKGQKWSQKRQKGPQNRQKHPQNGHQTRPFRPHSPRFISIYCIQHHNPPPPIVLSPIQAPCRHATEWFHRMSAIAGTRGILLVMCGVLPYFSPWAAVSVLFAVSRGVPAAPRFST